MDDLFPAALPDTRTRIEDALLEVIAAGEKLSHDRVAERAGLARRTVYRYFPDQTALREAMWHRIGPPSGMPKTLEALLEGLVETYRTFDDQMALMTVAMASPEGRAMRNVMKVERVAAYRSAFAEATAELPEPDRTWAIAAMQVLNSGLAWREMRDQWDMTGDQMAVACRWAIETLLADLRRRGDRPLAEGPAAR
jgi:AcrR family transcriptional regulator